MEIMLEKVAIALEKTIFRRMWPTTAATYWI